MKRLVLSLALAATACLPVAVSAQQMGPPPPSPSAEQRQQMRANFEQMRKLHEQFRSQVLGALSPEHRQLLAQVVGNLAVADHPDRKAAAAQLDAALSPGEKSAILAAASQMRDQMKSMMASMPKPPGAQVQVGGEMRRDHGTPTAGAILLMATGDHGMMAVRIRGAAPAPPQP